MDSVPIQYKIDINPSYEWAAEAVGPEAVENVKEAPRTAAQSSKDKSSNEKIEAKD